MTAAREIYEYIDSFAPFDSAMGFDNVGILVGDPEESSQLVLLALDVTSAVIEEAQKKGCKIIITHHPIIFSPLKSIPAQSLQYKLIRAGITVISAHTNLDICPGGVNDCLAEKIGLTIAEHTNEDCFLTAELEEKVSSEKLAGIIKRALDCKGLRFTRRSGDIKRVTVSCGAGGSNIFAAAKAGADAFVTGEIKHHEIVFARENNIAVYDSGHFRSEDVVIERLAQRMREHFPGTEFEKAEADAEGIEYI